MAVQRIFEFLVGLLFGVGLMLSGMTDPGKVIGFLDITGHWDPSLALVMAGAIGAGSLAFVAAKNAATLGWAKTLIGLRPNTSIGVWCSAAWCLGWVGAWLAFAQARPGSPWPQAKKKPSTLSGQ